MKYQNSEPIVGSMSALIMSLRHEGVPLLTVDQQSLPLVDGKPVEVLKPTASFAETKAVIDAVHTAAMQFFAAQSKISEADAPRSTGEKNKDKDAEDDDIGGADDEDISAFEEEEPSSKLQRKEA